MLGEVGTPVLHQMPPPLEQVRPRVGGLDLVGEVPAQPVGPAVESRPVVADAGDEVVVEGWPRRRCPRPAGCRAPGPATGSRRSSRRGRSRSACVANDRLRHGERQPRGGSRLGRGLTDRPRGSPSRPGKVQSAFNVRAGEARKARAAGTRQTTAPSPRTTTAAPPSTTGSRGVTSNSYALMNRAATRRGRRTDPRRPAAAPAAHTWRRCAHAWPRGSAGSRTRAGGGRPAGTPCRRPPRQDEREPRDGEADRHQQRESPDGYARREHFVEHP